MLDMNKMNEIQKLFADEDFVAKFNEINDLVDIKALFADNSVELSDVELKEFLNDIVKYGEQNVAGELSANELENVVGGSWTAALIIGGVCAVVSGTCMYKLRKLLGV